MPKHIKRKSTNRIVSKIEHYHLGELVVNLRKNGCTLNDITNTINDKYLASEGAEISSMAVSRYLDKVPEALLETAVEKTNNSINEYNEYARMLSLTESQLEVLEKNQRALRGKAASATVRQVSKIISELPDKAARTLLGHCLSIYINPSVKDSIALITASEKVIGRRQSLIGDMLQCKEKLFGYAQMQQLIDGIMKIVATSDLELYARICNEYSETIKAMFMKIPKTKLIKIKKLDK